MLDRSTRVLSGRGWGLILQPLPSYAVPHAPSVRVRLFLIEDLYEDWTMVERERLSNAYMDMLGRLAIHYMEVGQHQESIQACYRVLEKDRCHEDSYRLLMRCYVKLGLRGRALRQYRLCEKILRQEYGTAPSPETHALCRSIMMGHAEADT